MGERHKSRVVIDIERRQRRVRPFGDHFHVRKTLGRREGGARIDDGHVVAEKLGDRRQRLADVDGADGDELGGRHINREEDAALRGLFHSAFAAAQMLGKDGAQRILGDVCGFDETLFAAFNIGDDNDGAARGAFGVEGGEEI